MAWSLDQKSLFSPILSSSPPVTNHDEVGGWFTPANKPPRSVAEILAELADIRRNAEARGVDVAGRLKDLGIEDDVLFDDPWTQAQPARAKRKASSRRRK